MANANENNDTETQSQTDSREIDKFAGFATNDGEVTPPPATTGRVPNTGRFTAKEKPAKTDDEDGTLEADGDKHASADKRIGQAVGRQRAAERRAEAAEARATATEARLANIESRLTSETKAATAPKAPDPKDYEGLEYDARYLADVAKFEARQAVAAEAASLRTENANAALTTEQKAAVAAFTAKRDEFFATASEQYADFEDVVGDNANPVSQVIGELALDSEFGATILYELAGDPKEARRVAGLAPAKQAAWFGRQEVRYESSEDTGADEGGGDGESQSGQKSKVSKAPAVPDTTPRGTGTVPKTSGATTDFAAFERAASPKRK